MAIAQTKAVVPHSQQKQQTITTPVLTAIRPPKEPKYLRYGLKELQASLERKKALKGKLQNQLARLETLIKEREVRLIEISKIKT